MHIAFVTLYILSKSEHVKEAGLEDRISVINENALCLDYEAATAVFLYLVPRGLRIIKPYLTSTRWDLWPYSLVPRSLLKSATVKVVTYMSGLPGVEPKRRVNVEVPHKEGSGWPVYYYELERRGGVNMKKVRKTQSNTALSHVSNGHIHSHSLVVGCNIGGGAGGCVALRFSHLLHV